MLTSGTLIPIRRAAPPGPAPDAGAFPCGPADAGIRPVLVERLGDAGEPAVPALNPADDHGPWSATDMVMSRCRTIRLRTGRTRG